MSATCSVNGDTLLTVVNILICLSIAAIWMGSQGVSQEEVAWQRRCIMRRIADVFSLVKVRVVLMHNDII